MRALAGIVTAVLLAGMLAACSASQPQDSTVTLAPGMTVTLTGRAVGVKAEARPASVTTALARRLPVRLLAQPERVIFAGRLPADGVVLTWRINRKMLAPGVTPFVAALDQATGQWSALPATPRT
jgi:hypothetical protein